MLAVFVFIKLQDKLQDIEIRFGNNVLQSKVCLAGMKKPSPVVGGRGLRWGLFPDSEQGAFA